MKERILCVDDDPNILQAYKRSLRRVFQIETALGPVEALALIEKTDPFPVIVSDMRMPVMDGVEFLRRAMEVSPESIRMMLTGNNDLRTAMQAVNEGHIFRFLNKPCPPEVLTRALEAGIRQYQLVLAEKQLLELTLRGSIEVLSEVLSLASPVAFSRAALVKKYAVQIAQKLGHPDLWQVEVAAMLSPLGCITLPATILEKYFRGEPLTADEQREFASHPKVASTLLEKIPRLEQIAAAIAYQQLPFHSTSSHGSPEGEAIPLAARILKVVLDFLAHQSGGSSSMQAVEELAACEALYDPAVVKALRAVVEARMSDATRSLMIKELVPGMTLSEDLLAANGNLILGRGAEISWLTCERLASFAKSTGLREPVRVFNAKKPMTENSTAAATPKECAL